jgi:manganese/iron transport system substrate-binding protein
LMMLLGGCRSVPQASPIPKADGKLRVLATTSILGDVVGQVGGDVIELTVLLPVGADPHSFQPTPQDVVKVAEADVVFVSGLGLEGFLDNLLSNAGGDTRVVSASDGIAPRETHHDADEDHSDEVADDPGHADETVGGEEHEHVGGDPHVWVDPNNVMLWTKNIVRALKELDPANAAVYEANGAAYLIALQELDDWIKGQVESVPEADRKIVTDHLLFSYFVERYGFEQVGAIVPGYSSMAAPSAQAVAALTDAIKELDVKAVFVGNTVNSDLAERIAEDTGVNLVFLFTGSLSEPGGDADSYLEFVRYNVNAIVGALK